MGAEAISAELSVNIAELPAFPAVNALTVLISTLRIVVEALKLLSEVLGSRANVPVVTNFVVLNQSKRILFPLRRTLAFVVSTEGIIP